MHQFKVGDKVKIAPGATYGTTGSLKVSPTLIDKEVTITRDWDDGDFSFGTRCGQLGRAHEKFLVPREPEMFYTNGTKILPGDVVGVIYDDKLRVVASLLPEGIHGRPEPGVKYTTGMWDLRLSLTFLRRAGDLQIGDKVKVGPNHGSQETKEGNEHIIRKFHVFNNRNRVVLNTGACVNKECLTLITPVERIKTDKKEETMSKNRVEVQSATPDTNIEVGDFLQDPRDKRVYILGSSPDCQGTSYYCAIGVDNGVSFINAASTIERAIQSSLVKLQKFHGKIVINTEK